MSTVPAIAGGRERLALAGISAFGVIAVIWGLATLPFLYVAANRLVVGNPVAAQAAIGPLLWPIMGCAGLGAVLLARRSRAAAWAATMMFAGSFLLLAAALGSAAPGLAEGLPPATRVRLAAGAWIAFLLLACALGFAAFRTGTKGAGWLVGLGLLSALVFLYRSGQFDGLSLAVEYRVRSGAVHAALVQHLSISIAAMVVSALVCVLLGLWRGGHRIVDLAINGVQVVPGVALLGGLVALAAGLLKLVPGLRDAGFSALGPTPAIFGISAYLLLPFWRGIHAALRAPEPATLDAARALGLSPRQILMRVSLPLGAPILVGALRVAGVQAIGLATLGALVGAGGLGTIVFDGMAQFAPDLILLGAIPIIALSLGTERGLALVEDAVRRRWSA